MNPRQLRRLEKRKAHEARMAANRANAAVSTGPRTEAGKAASSRNNFRHGFTGAFCLLPSENREEFETLVQNLLAEHDPQTPTENVLISDIARHHWLLQRALRLQETCFAGATVDDKKLALYLRYQTTQQRAFHKALADLLKLRKQRISEEVGFESQKQKQARFEAGQKRADDKHRWAGEMADARIMIETARLRALDSQHRRENHLSE